MNGMKSRDDTNKARNTLQTSQLTGAVISAKIFRRKKNSSRCQIHKNDLLMYFVDVLKVKGRHKLYGNSLLASVFITTCSDCSDAFSLNVRKNTSSTQLKHFCRIIKLTSCCIICSLDSGLIAVIVAQLSQCLFCNMNESSPWRIQNVVTVHQQTQKSSSAMNKQ